MNESTLTVLADDEGNVLKYWNHVNIAEPTEENPKQKRPGVKNERVTFAAMVVEHGEYKGIKETVLQRVTKGKLA
jgi:DNA/RNA-binding domain of Phe-tRNA-synthetase-like protein